MRKIVIFSMMLFSIFSYTFAYDNTIEFGNMSFSSRLFGYQNNSQNIDFIALNPIFFNSGYKIFSINLLENTNQNNRSQTNQRIYTNSQGNILPISGFIFLSVIRDLGISTMNRQEHKVFSDRWEHQLEQEKMYRTIFSENRNFYGHY